MLAGNLSAVPELTYDRARVDTQVPHSFRSSGWGKGRARDRLRPEEHGHTIAILT